MNNKKIYWKVCLDEHTDIVMKKIIKSKGLTKQAFLRNVIKDYLLDNLDCMNIDEHR